MVIDFETREALATKLCQKLMKNAQSAPPTSDIGAMWTDPAQGGPDGLAALLCASFGAPYPLVAQACATHWVPVCFPRILMFCLYAQPVFAYITSFNIV